MASKKNNPSEIEIDLFRKAVEGTTPLQQKKIITTSVPESKTRRSRRQYDVQTPDENANPTYDSDYNQIAAGDILSFSRPGVKNQTLRKLRRGLIHPEAELDLHGMTVATAGRSLSSFLKRCQAVDKRCVKIIHGKGHSSKEDAPILKNRINDWLPLYPEVLAFCSTQPQDGGCGAVYVLLKRR